jgi:hypothetical protein
MSRMSLGNDRASRRKRGRGITSGNRECERKVAGSEYRHRTQRNLAQSKVAARRGFAIRQRAIDASMRGELRNAAMAMESYYGEFLEYPSNVPAILLVGYRNTAGVTLTINITSPSTYSLTAARISGTQASFTFDSATGLIN